METRRWTNPTQPQTLQIAVFLFYISAVFSVLGFNLFSWALAIGEAASGFGIANEKKWGYWLGVAIASLGLLPGALYIFHNGVGSMFNILFLLSIMFPVALFALLLHPMSRDYQRIWFR